MQKKDAGNENMQEITKEKLEKYFKVTEKALKKVKLGIRKDIAWESEYKHFLNMAQCYFKDARYFEEKGDIVNAFAALNYAHGWLDAGAHLGLFDVDGDNKLFTVDPKTIRNC